MTSVENLKIEQSDREVLNELYNNVVPSREAVLSLASENTETFTLRNENRFRAVVFHAKDPDGSVLFAPDEYMHGPEHVAGTIRALGYQALNPHATVVRLPNDRIGLGKSHTNLTAREKWELLTKDNFEPYIERIETILDQLPRDRRDAVDAPVVVSGLSQGAVPAGAYGAYSETRATGIVAVEAPNVVNRLSALGLVGLGLAFASSGPNLKNVIAENYAEAGTHTTIETDLNNELKLRGLASYMAGGLRAGNMALVPSMAKATLEQQLEGALDNGVAVLQAWATGADISPRDINRAIAEHLQERDLYEAYEFEGDHSLTNDNLRTAALARRAFVLPLLKTA